jgi:hypothetical protein
LRLPPGEVSPHGELGLRQIQRRLPVHEGADTSRRPRAGAS